MDRKPITQAVLAEKLQMSLATVNKAVNGGECYRTTAHRLCKFLGLNPADAMISRVSSERGDAA